MFVVIPFINLSLGGKTQNKSSSAKIWYIIQKSIINKENELWDIIYWKRFLVWDIAFESFS